MRALRAPGGPRPAELAAVAALALGAFAVAALISRQALGGVPHVADGVAYAFQGKVFAGGHLALEPPALPRLFGLENVILDARRWVAIYPPGWPALLAVGWWLGAPWLTAPLLLGLSVAGVWALGRSLFAPRTGLLAAGCLAVSPFALAMGSGFMAHVPCLAASLASMLCLAAARPDRPGRWLAAGLFAGLAVAIRPVTAVALLWPWALWSVRRAGGAPERLAALTRLGLGGLPPVLLLLAFDAAVFGSPFATGYRVADPTHTFTGEHGVHFPLLAIFRHHLPWYVRQLDRSLWGLPVPDLALLLPLAWPAAGRRRDALLLASAASLVVGYSFYYWADVVYGGPRLVFEAMGPLALLAARALETLYAGLRRLLERIGAARSPRLAPLLGALALALLAIPPLHGRLPAELARLSSWYHVTSALPLQLVERRGVGPSALVFVQALPPVYGPLLLSGTLPPQRSGRVFVHDVPALRRAAEAAYPRREIWHLGVELEPVPGPNVYPDTAVARRMELERWR